MSRLFQVILGKNLFFVACLVLFCQCSTSSDSNKECLKTFDWVVKTFKENDAGFKYYLEQKGEENIEKQTKLCREKVARATSELEAVRQINAWLEYFRKGHTGLFPKSPLFDESVKKMDLTEEAFRRYLKKNEKSLHPIEGIWETCYFTAGIIRDSVNAKQFHVFSLTDKGMNISKYCAHLADCVELADGKWESVFFMPAQNVSSPLYWLGQSQGVIYMQRHYWIKREPAVRFSPQDSVYCMQTSNKPFLLELDKRTLYFRVPSFLYEKKAFIDDLLEKNDHQIRSTPNLIIDIRNGTGGSDFSHWGLIPYYYTQPIRIVNQSFHATELGVKTYEGYAEEYKNDPKLAGHYHDRAVEMRKNIGNYMKVPLTSVIDQCKTSSCPQRIAVIFNHRNASADEGFLYMARQSYKVKLFGEPTAGAFDVSNVAIVDSPNGKYELWIAQSINGIHPEYAIDDIGIQPDFYIDREIGDWIGYTRSVIEAE